MKIYAIIDSDFIPDAREQKTYRVVQLASNYEEKKAAVLVEAESQAGIKDFKEDWDNPQTIGNFNAIPNRGDWEMNVYPTFDDGTSSFEDIFNRGKQHFERMFEDRKAKQPKRAKERAAEENKIFK